MVAARMLPERIVALLFESTVSSPSISAMVASPYNLSRSISGAASDPDRDRNLIDLCALWQSANYDVAVTANDDVGIAANDDAAVAGGNDVAGMYDGGRRVPVVRGFSGNANILFAHWSALLSMISVASTVFVVIASRATLGPVSVTSTPSLSQLSMATFADRVFR